MFRSSEVTLHEPLSEVVIQAATEEAERQVISLLLLSSVMSLMTSMNLRHLCRSLTISLSLSHTHTVSLSRSLSEVVIQAANEEAERQVISHSLNSPVVSL